MIIYITYIVFAFIIVQFIVALLNFIFIQRYKEKDINQYNLVSVLIPARNEEKNIANVLNDLIQQNYKNIEIIVFNDESTDNTEKILSEFSKNYDNIKFINSDGMPKGWLGKNYACHSLSQIAKGDYFLFLDADVRIYKDIIPDTLAFAKKHDLALISIFPKQVMRSLGERITVPVMNYILLTLLPLVLVRKSKFSSLSAANGQFMFFESQTYKKFLPHLKMKNKRVEDIEIARFYKNNKLKVACLAGKKDITCRMYNNYFEAINGFSKNVVSFFGNSLICAILFWAITSFGFIFVLLYFSLNQFIIYIVLFIFIRILVSIASNQNVFGNVLLSPLQHLSMGHMIFKSILNLKNKKMLWKERNIS